MQNSSTAITGLDNLNDGRYGIDDGSRSLESVDRRTVSLLRLLLAFAALLITFIDSSMPERFVVFTYIVLAGYCLYSLSLYFFVLRKTFLIPVRFTHWIDV